MKYFIECLKKYATFQGRARRKEYWFFVLFQFLVMLFLMFACSIVFAISGGGDEASFSVAAMFIVFGYMIATIVPGLAVTSRRLHDIGKSGTWFFIYFVPLIGGIWLLVLMLTEGNYGRNQYGPDPKNEEPDVFDFEKA